MPRGLCLGPFWHSQSCRRKSSSLKIPGVPESRWRGNAGAAATGQQGVALLTVLLVTALMSVLVLSMSWQRQLEMRRTANLAEGEQSLLLALGVEDWAGKVLQRDRSQNTLDNGGENWAQGLPPTPVEQGLVSGRINDLQGQLNLNNLVSPEAAVATLAEKRLERLMKGCGGSTSEVSALADWLDKDGEMRPNGAEDRVYLLRQPAYRTGNRPLVNPSELLLVAGITPEIYACLAGAITTLPETTLLNVNTATPLALSSLSDQLPLATAEQLVKERPPQGYKDLAAFLATPALAGTGLSSDGLALASSYFLVAGQATVGNAETRLYSVLHRSETGAINIISRSIGTY
ncbi:MAG: type II secretion system minor pseudopilin GspK [Desulfobulbaceae bacterium]|nr:type II secretion system minor pseudopilin GspK [Desulfobulbaceae bacterium]